jgi:hypothetical protein
VKGFLVEFGGLLTIYKRLKGTISMDVGLVNRPYNPVPQIKYLRNSPIVPGVGLGFGAVYLGFNFGVHYQID